VDDDVQAAVDRLARRVAALELLLAAAQERNFELRIAADFAESERAGHVDRSGLDA
jgi:hypothetical protein